MPLLNKKRLLLTPPMNLERKKRRKEVYYLKCTNEVFSTYESYIKRWMLCQRPIWECEVTGKQDLTYQQAKESEKAQEKRVEIKFCPVLRKRLLSFIQFQTIGLDELTSSLHNTFRYSYSIGEIIHCYLGGHTYIGKIMNVVPNPNYVPTTKIKEEDDKTNDNNVPRQANGRLRFPDAFLHPEATTNSNNTSTTTEKKQILPSEKYKNRYSIQLIDNQGKKLENIERTIDRHEINRDSTIFNMSNLQQLVRECATRDTYDGAPWVLKENVAMNYNISTELPPYLQQLQEVTYQTIIKKRQYNRKTHGNHQSSHGNGNTSTWSIHSPSSYNKEEREAERQARREQHLRLKLQRKMEKERLREEKRKQAAVKYPIEDLDLPIYRKDPNQNWALIDMTPTNGSSSSPLFISSSSSIRQHEHKQQQNEIKEIKIENNDNNINEINHHHTTTYNNNNYTNNENNINNNLDMKDTIKPIHIPYPSGGRDPRPKATPKIFNDLTEEHFDDIISIWSFLTVFSVPLKLNTISLDTFENSILTTTTTVSTTTNLSSMVQSFISLINVIINERQETTTSDLLSGEIMEIYLEDHPSEDEENSDDGNEDEDVDEEDQGDNNEKNDHDKKDGKRGRKKKKKNNKKIEDEESDQSDDESAAKKRLSRRRKEENKNIIKIKIKQQTENDKDINDEIGWRLKEPLRLCKGWDQKEIRLDRSPTAIKNWIISLIGCLNDIATPDLIPNVNDILKHLLPRPHSTIAERDRQFLSLSLSCKLQLLNFLVMVVNESSTIKNYMDECQEQMTELRRQKVELNKEYRSLLIRKNSLDKKERKKKRKAIKEKNGEGDNNDVNDSAIDDDDDEYNNDSNNESNSDEEDDYNEENNSDDEMEDTLDESDDQSYDSNMDDEDSEIAEQSDSSKQANKRRKKNRGTKYGHLHLSRQAKLKQKKIKQIALEESKRRENEKKREEAKLKLQASKQKAEDKRILEEEEQNLKQKEEQLEREMRQYMTLRIRPLGKDRFYNRYFYLDNVGIKDHHGTGRIYIQNPTYVDILHMMDRDNISINEELICGRGGGREFIIALMKEHGLVEEITWLENRMNELQQEMDRLDTIKKDHGSKMNHSSCSKHPILNQYMHHQKERSWWQYYSHPKEIQQLLAWLNPKGIREYKLRNEIAKHLSLITESMEKRDKMEKQGNIRVTKGKKA